MKLDLNNLQRNYEDAVEHLVPIDITDKHYDLTETKPGKPVPMEIPELKHPKKPKLSIAKSLKGRDGDKTEVPHVNKLCYHLITGCRQTRCRATMVGHSSWQAIGSLPVGHRDKNFT